MTDPETIKRVLNGLREHDETYGPQTCGETITDALSLITALVAERDWLLAACKEVMEATSLDEAFDAVKPAVKSAKEGR